MPDAAVFRDAADLCGGAETGHAEQDTAAVCAVLEAKAGVKRKAR